MISTDVVRAELLINLSPQIMQRHLCHGREMDLADDDRVDEEK